MRLSEYTIDKITEKFYLRNFSDDHDDVRVLYNLLEEIELTFVKGDSSQSLLEWKDDKPSNKNSNTGGKEV